MVRLIVEGGVVLLSRHAFRYAFESNTRLQGADPSCVVSFYSYQRGEVGLEHDERIVTGRYEGTIDQLEAALGSGD